VGGPPIVLVKVRFWKKPSFYRGLVAVMFIVAGAVHLLWPRVYVQAMPPYIPYPMAMILLSGVFELAGGIGILIPRTRRMAGFGLLLLLVAVFPVNIHMFLERWHKGSMDLALLLLFLRLPLQAEFMRWVWRALQPSEGKN
jgi:uncharacterized membrane protein